MDYRWTHLGYFKLLNELRDYELTCASRSAFVSSSLIIHLMRSRCPDFGTTALNSSTSSLSKSRLDPSISLSKRENDRINLNFEKTKGIRTDTVVFDWRFNELYIPLNKSRASWGTLLLLKREISCSVVKLSRSITVLKLISCCNSLFEEENHAKIWGLPRCIWNDALFVTSRWEGRQADHSSLPLVKKGTCDHFGTR